MNNTQTRMSARYFPCVQLASLKNLYLPIRKEDIYEDEKFLLFI